MTAFEYYFMKLMRASCHLNRLLNIEMGVEYQLKLLFQFLTVPLKFILGHLQELEKVA